MEIRKKACTNQEIERETVKFYEDRKRIVGKYYQKEKRIKRKD